MAKLIRFPAEIEERLAIIADTERRSFTAQVIRAIEEWLAARERPDAGPPAS